MKIKEIQVKNFRSIEEITINFKENPRVLVGINEAGKTNIIEALRLLSNEFQIKNSDIRITEKGTFAEEAYILFKFELETNELEEILQKLSSIILTDDTLKPIIRIKENNFGLREFVFNFCKESNYLINIVKNIRDVYLTSKNEKMELLPNFKKPKTGVSFNLQNQKGETINIVNFKLIDTITFPQIPSDKLEEANSQILLDEIENLTKEKVVKNLPKVIYWKYDEMYLLPSSISINSFINNLNSCIPLKNMFNLADIPDNQIAKKINEARQSSPNMLWTLMQNVSKVSTEFLKNAWPEYKDIKISLRLNGDNINCGIEGKTIQDFSIRSDGFKRFISMLLLLSIPAKKELLKNALILIDEADQSLHPSSCRYLMQQLIEIAKYNYVMYTTHSIFMIDRNNIRRHYIVEKNNEITIIKEADENNYLTEEVIFGALGASVYDVLKEKNILFEGWTDKNLFETVVKSDKELQLSFGNVGVAIAKGISSEGVQVLSSILELAQRKLLIISDADPAAKEKQKRFVQNKKWGIWKRYDELLRGRKVETCEDFIKKEVLKKYLFEILEELKINFQGTHIELPEHGRLSYVKKWLSKNGINDKSQNEIIRKLKERIFKNLTIDKVEEDYFELIEILKERVRRL